MARKSREPLFLRLYLNGHSAADPLASPARANLSGLAPLLMVVGGCETLLDEMTQFAGLAAASGCDVTLHVFDGLPHNFIKFIHPAADAVYALFASWVTAQTGGLGSNSSAVAISNS